MAIATKRITMDGTLPSGATTKNVLVYRILDKMRRSDYIDKDKKISAARPAPPYPERRMLSVYVAFAYLDVQSVSLLQNI